MLSSADAFAGPSAVSLTVPASESAASASCSRVLWSDSTMDVSAGGSQGTSGSLVAVSSKTIKHTPFVSNVPRFLRYCRFKGSKLLISLNDQIYIYVSPNLVQCMHLAVIHYYTHMPYLLQVIHWVERNQHDFRQQLPTFE